MSSPLEDRAVERGIKLSGQRRVIAGILSGADDRPDAEELYRRASRIDERISLATVYRTLRLFEEAGLVARRDAGDGRARYDGRCGDAARPEPPAPCGRAATPSADPFARSAVDHRRLALHPTVPAAAGDLPRP